MSRTKRRAAKRLEARIKEYDAIREPNIKRGFKKPGSLSGRK